MARILITSGPTRQYLDPVRYLSNASSGKMGSCLAVAALEAGHEVVVVSGPVSVEYPTGVEVVDVVSTDDMLAACLKEIEQVDGVIAAAAPCDYRPLNVAQHKLGKTGGTQTWEFCETEDVLAALGKRKRANQWSIGFALETEHGKEKALAKLQRKQCDWIVLNAASAINSDENGIRVFNPAGETVVEFKGPKLEVARKILALVPS